MITINDDAVARATSTHCHFSGAEPFGSMTNERMERRDWIGITTLVIGITEPIRQGQMKHGIELKLCSLHVFYT